MSARPRATEPSSPGALGRLRPVEAKAFRSLHVRNYRLYFLGQLVSLTGSWMQTVALGWLVLKLSDSGVALGVVAAFQEGPTLVAGVWGGLIADRLDKRRLLIVTETTMAAVAAALAALTLGGVVEVWMIYALTLVVGCVSIVDSPASQVFVTEMVEPEGLANAVGLNSAMFQGTRVLGPAVAAGVIVTLGIGACFLFNAVSYLSAIGGLVAMRPQELHPSPPLPRAKNQVRAGLHHVWRARGLRSTMALLAVVGTLGFNFTVVLPLLVKDSFGAGAGTYGLFTAAMGTGSLAGALLVATRARPTRPMLLGAAVSFGVLSVGASLAPGVGWEMPLLVLVGGSGIAFLATTNASLQLRSDPAMRGRVMALFGLLVLGSTAVGGPLIGWVSQQFGARAGLGLGGLATLTGVVAFGPSATGDLTSPASRAGG